MQLEESQSSRKKQKADRTTNTATLTEDELQELANVVAKVAQDNLGGISTQQESIAAQVQTHLNQLTTTINEVKHMVDTKAYRTDPNIPRFTPPWEPPIKVLIQTQALDMKEETTIDTDNRTTKIEFSKLLLDEIYIIQ